MTRRVVVGALTAGCLVGLCAVLGSILVAWAGQTALIAGATLCGLLGCFVGAVVLIRLQLATRDRCLPLAGVGAVAFGCAAALAWKFASSPIIPVLAGLTVGAVMALAARGMTGSPQAGE